MWPEPNVGMLRYLAAAEWRHKLELTFLLIMSIKHKEMPVLERVTLTRLNLYN